MAKFSTLVRRLARVVLGLFILWQIVFLFGWNFWQLADAARPRLKRMPFVKRLAPHWLEEEGEVRQILAATERVPARWAALTGQAQDWSLFAPNVDTDLSFPVVELRWEDHPPVRLLSENEPADVRHFFRVGNFRLRCYETDIAPVREIAADAGEMRADAWRGEIETKLRRDSAVLHAYLRWRLEVYRRTQPELPLPREVVLAVRSYHIPSPPGPDPWDWQHPEQLQPVVRWLPGTELGPAFYPLEMYNPVMDRFEKLRRPSESTPGRP